MARGPLSPASDLKVTLAPSCSERKPSPAIALWWTNRSFEPSSGVMKPNPFSSLNHFTVPLGMLLLLCVCAADAEDAKQQRRRALARFARLHGLAYYKVTVAVPAGD